MKRRTFMKSVGVLASAVGGGSALSLALPQGSVHAAIPESSFMYALRDTGIWRYTGTPLKWEQIESSLDVKQLEGTAEHLIQLRQTGEVLCWKQKGSEWETIDHNPKIIHIAIDNVVDNTTGRIFTFQLTNEGNLLIWNGGQKWTQLCQVKGAISLACAPFRGVFILCENGDLYFYDTWSYPEKGELSLVDHVPERVAIATTNRGMYVRFEIWTDGSIRLGKEMIATNMPVTSIASSEGGEDGDNAVLNVLQTDHTIHRYRSQEKRWEVIGTVDAGAIAVTSNEFDELFLLCRNNRDSRHNGIWFYDRTISGWFQLDNYPRIERLVSGPTRVARRPIASKSVR